MATFTANPATVTLTAPAGPYRRADLEIHGVDHSRASFQARLFINNPGASAETPPSDRSYAGSFWVFGHGGCAGDAGHCEPPSSRRAFDLRPEHQLTPMSKRVMITGRLRELVQPGAAFTVSIVPYVRPESADRLPEALLTDLLQFDRVDLLAYQ